MSRQPERIQKILAQHGIGSRRKIEQLIEQEQITVNGKLATLGCKISSTDLIKIAGKKINLHAAQNPSPTRVILYNKPLGEICSRSDPEGRPTVFANLPELEDERWVAVGRLDINTSGLLLFTNNGEVAHKLMHPSTNIKRKYAVRIFGEVSQQVLVNLSKGVRLDDGLAKFDSIQAAGGQGINKWYHVTLREGRNREVRRLWQSQDLQVSRIMRIQFGPLHLPEQLKMGNWLELTSNEISGLLASC